jgi:uncharacterized membrane protein
VRLRYRLFISAFILVVCLNAGSLFLLPDGVAIHFNRAGEPDQWMGREASALILIGITALLFASFFLSARILKDVPGKYVSLPSKDYWLREENRGEAVARFSGLMYEFGAVTLLLMALVTVMTIHANLSDPVRLAVRPSFYLLVVYLAYTAWWIVRIVLSFRVPKR